MTTKGRYDSVDLKGVSQFAVVSCLFVLTLICSAPVAWGQRNLTEKDASEPADDFQRMPSDRKIVQQLQELSRLARGGEVAKIRDTLQRLQAADPSLMVADGSKTFRPLHRDLIERIQAFPPTLQAELLKHPGATPRALQIAWEDGGSPALVTFLHRHSGSTESLKAHLLLAAIHRDRGHRQATLYWLLPVLHSGAPADLQRIAIAMRDEVNAAIVNRSSVESKSGSGAEQSQEAGEPTDDAVTDPLNPETPAAEAEEAPVDKVEVTADGSPGTVAPVTASVEQTPVASVVFPSSPAWTRTLHLNSTQRRASQDLVRLLAMEGQEQAIAWTASEPDVNSQAIYVRSSGGLLALDLATGKVLWSRLLDRQQDARRIVEPGLRFPDGIDDAQMSVAQLLNSREVLELHRDEVTSGMTADASRLFVLCDTGESFAASPEFNQPFGMLQRRGDMVSRTLRELLAIEKSTGRRLWSAGGAPLEERFGNELSRAWFAGPPTVSGGLLFGLVERDDAHWLVCLRSETGEVVWKLMLAYPETQIFQDPGRQLSASRPLVADGMIWTTTNDGMLIAVDALTHSVVWIRRMSRRESGVSQMRSFRNIPMPVEVQPFHNSWRPDAMLLISDSLIIQGVESHQLQMIHPLTGSVRRSISPDTATVILAADDESIIVAGPGKIQRLRLEGLKVVWAAALEAADVVPTGPGTRRNDQLWIPFSDGSIRIVRYSDGHMIDRLPAMRPALSAGGLKSVHGDVVSYGPDHISLFSQSVKATDRQPDPLEQARLLFQSGQFAAAEKILTESSLKEQSDSERSLLFKLAAARTLSEPTHRDEHLKHAAACAVTPRDHAIVQFLTVETNPEITPDVVADFLKAAPALLNSELPEPELLKRQLLNPMENDPSVVDPATGQLRFITTRPVRNYLLSFFEQHLARPDSSGPSPWLSSLPKISDEDMLLMKLDPAFLQNELLRRADDAVKAGRMTECTWHMLLQARRCADQIRGRTSEPSAVSRTSDVFKESFTALVDQFCSQLAAEAARRDLALRPHPAALNLLDVARAEILPAVAAERPPSPHELLSRQWSAWKDQTYSVVPVNPLSNNSMPQPNESVLSIRDHDDPFLSAWRWSTFREPSVLALRSFIKPDEPLCTIDGGMFDAISNGDSGSVMRFGSVVLVRNSMGLSAVSLIDQRVLWNRRVQNQSHRSLWPVMAGVRIFSSFSTSLESWQQVFGRDLRICGGNDRWICLQSPSRVEMIDLLTGQNLWSLPIPASPHTVFATESCVFLSHDSPHSGGDDSQSVTCLSRNDGTPHKSAIPGSQLQQTICVSGDELVTWSDASPGVSPAALKWVNSVTGDVRLSLELNDMINCQFFDAQTLVSVTSKGTFEVIDLLTAAKQVLRFSAEANDGAEAEKGTTPEHLTRALIMADAANYYVLPFPDQQTVQMQLMTGIPGDLQLYPITKELRAVDRITGKIRWVWDAKEDTTAWLEPTETPILLLVSLSPRRGKVKAPPFPAIGGFGFANDRQTTITALSRITGTKLFDYNVSSSSRFPVTDLVFRITPQQHLDLQAFGNRVRFVPEPAPAAVP